MREECSSDSRPQLDQFTKFLPGIMWLEDPITRRLEYLSLGFAEELGLAVGQLPSTLSAWLPLIHPGDQLDLTIGALAIEYPCQSTFRIRDRSGRWRSISCRQSLVRKNTGEIHCIAGYAEDVTQAKSLERAVQELSEALQNARSQERRRIARELHDGTGQEIADVALTLSRLETRLPSTGGNLQQILAESRSKLEQCSRSIRVYTHLQHPPLLEELGLVRALRHFIRGFTERTGIEVTLEAGQTLPIIPVELAAAFYRITQESLNNIYKHSGSSGASVHLSHTRDLITLQIRDRGRGLPAGLLEEATGEGCFGVGILGMRERMHLLGGQLKIESGPQGTNIIALCRTQDFVPTSD